jgi:hypothetical protein
MKNFLTKRNIITSLLAFVMVLAFSPVLKAQYDVDKTGKVEKLVLYENFGGYAAAGSSVSGIQPQKWPAVLADSGKSSGWYTTVQKLDKTNSVDSVPQFMGGAPGNGYFHIDSVAAYRTGGTSGLGITIESSTKNWEYTAPLLNGYTYKNTSNVGFRFWGATVLPNFYSWNSYGKQSPSYNKRLTDEKGYIYFGKYLSSWTHPKVTIPFENSGVLTNISKIEMMISGCRIAKNNVLEVVIEAQNSDADVVETKTYTYSASLEPRIISIPVDYQYCRIYLRAWGDNNGANVLDYAMLSGNDNTAIDTRTTYNYNAIACTTPDNATSAGVTGNPNISIHMIKLYAYMTGTYSVTTNSTLVSGTTSGLTYGQTTKLTAASTNGSGNKFMGWKITGKDDLSEVANPLTLTIDSSMSVYPVYAGDTVLVPVVNENFTNWTKHGSTMTNTSSTTYNNRLNFASAVPVDTISTTVKVPFRYGFTYKGSDSLSIKLNRCNVIPTYGPRVYNEDNASNYTGYIAFMGPNDKKGYISIDTVKGISKVTADVSSYDLPAPIRGCVFKVNGSIVRNKMLQTIYPQTVKLSLDSTAKNVVQIGWGNQAYYEYLTPYSASVDVTTSSVSAACIALHNLKMYAKVVLPSKNYYKISSGSITGGTIAGYAPASNNSTNQYMEGTKVTVTAVANTGYGFDYWKDGSGNKLSSSNPIDITLTSDTTVTPVFAQYPTYLTITGNYRGTVTPSITPTDTINGNTYEFVAGVALKLTADPNFGFTFNKWTINGKDYTSNPYTIPADSMIKNKVSTLTVTYDSITSRSYLKVSNLVHEGTVSFDNSPDDTTIVNDSVKWYRFPTGESIAVTANPGYGYGFKNWKSGQIVAKADTTTNPVTITLSKDTTMTPVWSVLNRDSLILRTGTNGTIEITDSHKSGTKESQGWWPADYRVEITAHPKSGYVLSSIGDSASCIFKNDSVITVVMDRDTVVVRPEFTKQEAGVVVCINENFQDATKWPQASATSSNVPGAIDFLGLSDSWDPTQYNDNLEKLLTILAPYRVWGSESNDHSDGPNGTKTPYTTLSLSYTMNTPYTVKLQVGSSKDSVSIKVANYAPCNNCLIGKAVKGAYVSYAYLGHVTPGMVALKKPTFSATRNSDTYGAFMANDTVGMMELDGMAYIEKLKIGFVASGTQQCPGVFYTVDPTLSLIDDYGRFAPSTSDLYSIGQLGTREAAYTPYNNKYGWGACQEGMIMDQNMYIAEEGVSETRVLITAGYKTTGSGSTNVYSYSDVYIHDLKVWGSPMSTNGIEDLISNKNADNCKMYELGSTNVLRIDADEVIKAIVIYNIDGKAVKVVRENTSSDNEFNISELKRGVYGVHAYGRSGKQYKGSFGKAND